MRPLARGLVADLAMPRKHIEIPPAAARAFVRSAPRHMEEAWTSEATVLSLIPPSRLASCSNSTIVPKRIAWRRGWVNVHRLE
jgi:hypothetical protein